MRTIELIMDEQQNYFMREAFNTLRTNVLFCGKQVKTIVMTSCFAHEGKSTVSFELCRSLCEASKKVLLVDADLRKSVMATRHTKQRGICGLSQLLSGQVSTEDAIYHTQYEGLDVVFAGPYPPNPAELVGSIAFKELIQELRPQYDYIIIDAPPLGLVIDAAVMASVCDGAILVIDSGRVKYKIAQNVKDQLEKSGCKLLGVVLNQTTKKNKKGAGGVDKSQYAAYQSYSTKSATQLNAAAPRMAQPKPMQPQPSQQARPMPRPQQPTNHSTDK